MPPTINPANEGDNDSASVGSSADEKLLRRIRERFDYMVQAWREIRAAGDVCMRALSPEGPWDPKDREERKSNGRPCIHLDQMGQYVNGFMGEVRQNPTGVKVDPEGGGATDTSAELRSDRMRQIAYDSNADQATLTALENAVERGYGSFGIITAYKTWDSDEQVIKYRRFANPDAVLWDPDCKEADWSDMEDGFYLDRYSFADFKSKFGDTADTTNFGAEHMALAPNWISKEWGVQVGEYWRIEKTKRTIYWIRDGSPKGRKVFKHQLPDGAKCGKESITLPTGQVLQIQNMRETEEPALKQYLTNGVEILDSTDFPGTQVPIFPIIGKERYITDGHQAKRVIYSYITMAIDGQMLFDYYKTNEAEEVGLTPKPKYAGYEGQFATSTDWKNINKLTDSFVQFKAVVDGATNQVLPLPRWDAYTPNIAALDIGSESARRAIQSALGSYGFTKTDDTNVKSGVAIKQLDRKGDLASYHLIDSYKLAIQRAGKVTNELLDAIEGKEPAERGIRKPDGTHKIVKVNQPSTDDAGQPQHLTYQPTEDAQHGVTISTGPSYQSQREEASALVDTLVAGQIPGIERILAPMVRLKNVGPIGDEIADRLELPEFKKDQEKQDPAEMAKLIQQYEHALEDAMKQLDEYKAGLPKIQADQKNTEAKIASDQKIAELKIAADKEIAAETLRVEVLKVESKEALTLLGHQVSEITGRLDQLAAEGQQAAEHAHASETQAADQQHATETQQADHAQEQQTQAADQAHQQEMQAGQQDHASQLAEAQQGHEEGMQQADIAAQPPPPTTSD